jgi:hypothetical protein
MVCSIKLQADDLFTWEKLFFEDLCWQSRSIELNSITAGASFFSQEKYSQFYCKQKASHAIKPLGSNFGISHLHIYPSSNLSDPPICTQVHSLCIKPQLYIFQRHFEVSVKSKENHQARGELSRSAAFETRHFSRRIYVLFFVPYILSSSLLWMANAFSTKDTCT